MTWWLVTAVLTILAAGSLYLLWVLMKFLLDLLFEGPFA
jgi:hypothetical protein